VFFILFLIYGINLFIAEDEKEKPNIEMLQELLNSFKSGNKATVTAESIDRKRFDFTFSLKSFTDTINKLEGK